MTLLRTLSVVLVLTLLTLPFAAPAAATGAEPAPEYDAVILVRDSDLPALLEAGAFTDYALMSAAELGLDVAALTRSGTLREDALLTPAELGLGTPDTHLFPLFGGFSPFFHGFLTLSGTLTAMLGARTITTTFANVPVPVFFFRPFTVFPFVPFKPFGRVLVVRFCC